MFIDSDAVHLFFVTERETRTECFVGLFKGTERIKKIVKSANHENYYFEWEEIRDSVVRNASEDTIVHLVFHGVPREPNSIVFGIPGNSLQHVTLDEEEADISLGVERLTYSEEHMHLWSLPVGWESSELKAFLKDNCSF
ncbi:hypothetical protein [Corynebacterium sp. A21]|uniref:hypothetical protein n=1 Tax=Corynebacterium sp. A21 TaxID=3457318 RepID=UPI003FD29FA9